MTPNSRDNWQPCCSRWGTTPYTRWNCRSAIVAPDTIIDKLSVTEQRVIVTKDSDFVDSFLLRHEPWKLLLVSTGNIRNVELFALFISNIKKIADNFEAFDFIEINRTDLIIHS